MLLKYLLNLTNQSKITIKTILLIVAVVFYDFLVDALLSLLHSLFEFIEHAFDFLIELLSLISPYTTEFIVFCIMFSVSGFLAYIETRSMPKWYSRFMDGLINSYPQEKAKALNYWHNQSPIKKIQCVSLCITGITFIFLWLFY
jgi:hypothetical protein